MDYKFKNFNHSYNERVCRFLIELSTDKGNCYLYEKMGYYRTGKSEVINDKLTLVFYEK